MRTLLLLLALSAAAYGQKAIGYQVVTEFPGSPTVRQVVIKSDTVWMYRAGEWRALPVPYVLISGGGSTDSTVFATVNRMLDSLADVRSSIPSTASFVAKGDSTTMPGYVTRTQFAADSTYKAAQIALKKANSDTSAATGYLRVHQLYDKGGSYAQIKAGSRYFFAKNDSSAAGGGDMYRADSSTYYMTLPTVKDSLGDHRTTIDTKQPIITNLADTSKYVETGGPASVPTAGASGYVLKKSSATNYDYAWATDVSAGSWTELKRTSADTTCSVINQGMKRIGDLGFTVAANSVYEISATITYGNVAATTTGLVLGFTGPTATVAALTVQIPLAVDGVGGEWQGWLNGAADSSLCTATPVTSSYFTAYMFGRIYVGANAGTFYPTFRPDAAAAITVRQYSTLDYRKLN